jgi:hypothetical protein
MPDMDYKLVDLFIKENDAWDHMINRQREELPQLDALISTIGEEWDGQLKQERTRILEHLKKEMVEQRQSMERLKEELAVQQSLLAQERKRPADNPSVLQTLNSQNVLRNRIRDVEKRFVELKCNYLNYVATI